MSDRSSYEQDPAISSDRSFGWVMAAFFSLVALWPLWGAGKIRWTALEIGVAVAILTLVRPQLLNPLNIVWHKFGLLLGKVIGPLVMGALFFIVVAPLGLLRRIAGADPLRRRKPPIGNSYWIPRSRDGAGTMRDQF